MPSCVILPFAMSRLLTANTLHIVQIVIAIILVVAILLQSSNSSVGGALGGRDNMSLYHTKRGFEKFLFIATIVLGIVFAGLSVLAIVLGY